MNLVRNPFLSEKPPQMDLTLRIILENPVAGVDHGLQVGKGADSRTIQTQRADGGDLRFEARVTVKQGADGSPNFLGPFTQGPPSARFIYIDIGQSAGQVESPWLRRLKVPLSAISWALIEEITADPGLVPEARLPGTAKDGGPSCATVRPPLGWKTAR